MTDLLEIFIERGDLAHLALLLWAASASGLGWFALRELTAASRRLTTLCASSRASTSVASTKGRVCATRAEKKEPRLPGAPSAVLPRPET